MDKDKEKKKKESILDLAKYLDKQIRVKFSGGREGEAMGRTGRELHVTVLITISNLLKYQACIVRTVSAGNVLTLTVQTELMTCFVVTYLCKYASFVWTCVYCPEGRPGDF